MRELKFRAWDNKRRQWLSLVNLHMDMTGTLFWSFGGECNFWGEPEKEGIILMQFTGLKDKNGKEIYEGDMLRPIIMNGCITDGIVEFKRGCFIVRQIGAEGLYDCLNTFRNFEIIGNIHENPELLEQA